MKRARWILAAGLIFAGAAPSQDLPPGVVLLGAVKRHIRDELQRLPNISCLETVRREHQPPNGKWRPTDTVRLEVLTNGVTELYASPGDRTFSERHPITYASSGTLSDGYFGVYLKTILVTGSVSYTYRGEEEIGGARLARWDYHLPEMWSGQRIDLPEGSGKVGLNGSFWADPKTLDVLRLDLNAEDFPPAVPLTEAFWSIRLARTSLDEGVAVLLPQAAEFRMTRFTGDGSRSRIDFTQCRVFGAESRINFDAPDSAPQPAKFATASLDDTLRTLPAGLKVAVKLRSRISAQTAVGALIDGLVAGSVSSKGRVIIAAGSPVRGRIRQLEYSADPIPHFVVAVEFTEVELNGIRHRFYADLVEIGFARGVEQELTVSSKASASRDFGGAAGYRTEVLSMPRLPGVATVFIKGEKLELPAGFQTIWKTRPLDP